MRTILVCVAGASLLMAGSAQAATQKKKQTPVAAERQLTTGKAQPSETGYYERVLERAPFGSQLWWRIYHSYPRG